MPCPEKASDYSFLNLWSWADVYGLEWAWTPELVWIRQSRPVEKYWAPVGDWKRVDWADNHAASFQRQGVLSSVCRKRCCNYGSRPPVSSYEAQPSRGHWDYLYSVTDLVELKGNKFHKKKNLLNQFRKKYDYRYISSDPGQYSPDHRNAGELVYLEGLCLPGSP